MLLRKSPSIVYWLGDNLYLSITNMCPDNCYFCVRNFRDGVGGFNLKLQKGPSTNEALTELQNVINLRNWSEIVFCGFGESTERLDCILEVVKWIKKNYGKILSIRLDTNGQGYLLNKGREVVNGLKEAGVDVISVSLNAHDKETYDQICKPSFNNAFGVVLEFIEKAKENFALEITAVAVPEVNVSKIKEIASKMQVRFRIRECIPRFW